MSRPDWGRYFLDIAWAVSARASCPRARCGAVLVGPDNRILATGYNGAPAGAPHCLEDGCLMADGHCQRSVHAEVNAVAQAARWGVRVAGATAYVVRTNTGGSVGAGCCRECLKVLTAAGIYDIVEEDGG